MTDTEKQMRERHARLQAMLDQLDREAARMREIERLARRLKRLNHVRQSAAEAVRRSRKLR